MVVTVTPSPSNTTQFCDGRWQSLVVTKLRRTSSLLVGSAYSTVSSGGPSNSADTDGSLYLGGLPGEVASNCACLMIFCPPDTCHTHNTSTHVHISQCAVHMSSIPPLSTPPLHPTTTYIHTLYIPRFL